MTNDEAYELIVAVASDRKDDLEDIAALLLTGSTTRKAKEPGPGQVGARARVTCGHVRSGGSEEGARNRENVCKLPRWSCRVAGHEVMQPPRRARASTTPS